MNSPRQPQFCASIAEWLLIATKDLCEPARARVTLEIETHYQEAVEAHLAAGEPQLGAEASALEELGDASAAARRLRRKHLTEKEAKKVQGLMTRATKTYSINIELAGCSGSIWIFLVWLDYLSPSSHSALRNVCLVLAVLGIFCELWLSRHFARQLSDRSAIGRILLIHLLGQTVFIAAFSVVMFDQFRFYFIYGVIYLLPWLRIWLKVRTDKADSDITLNLQKT